METGIGDLTLFPALDAIEQAHLRGRLRAVRLPPGHRVFESGRACDSYVLVRSGRVRVHQLDEDGREVVLYRLGPGESCILNVAALLAHETYAAYAVTETPVDALTLSVAHFGALVNESADFRSFVFRAHAERLADLMQVIRDVAFTRIDIRLAGRLLELSDGKDRLAITHAELAVELGTAREVVSRQLKTFERAGWLDLHKGAITIRTPDSLEALADKPPRGKR